MAMDHYAMSVKPTPLEIKYDANSIQCTGDWDLFINSLTKVEVMITNSCNFACINDKVH